MSDATQWHHLGEIDTLKAMPLQQINIGRARIALSYRDG